MKKAKIVLSAAGLLSIIAGAFAFKAQHKFGGQLKCYTALKVVTFAPSYTISASGVTLNCTIAGAPKTNASTKRVTVQA